MRVPALPSDLMPPIMIRCFCKQIPCECLHRRADGLAPPRLEIPPDVQYPSPRLKLDMSLNRNIGSGTVYTTQNPSLSGHSESAGSSAHQVPPLAIKFALRNRNKNILREVWFYEELQSLQGSVLPRCYGYFQATIPPDCTCIVWQAAEKDAYGMCKANEDDDESFEQIGTFDPAHQTLVTKLVHSSGGATITLLLLDLLGEPYLPIGKPLSDNIT